MLFRSGVTGKFGLGIRNEAGQRLIEFCQENPPVITNTFFQHPGPTPSASHLSGPRGGAPQATGLGSHSSPPACQRSGSLRKLAWSAGTEDPRAEGYGERLSVGGEGRVRGEGKKEDPGAGVCVRGVAGGTEGKRGARAGVSRLLAGGGRESGCGVEGRARRRRSGAGTLGRRRGARGPVRGRGRVRPRGALEESRPSPQGFSGIMRDFPADAGASELIHRKAAHGLRATRETAGGGGGVPRGGG